MDGHSRFISDAQRDDLLISGFHFTGDDAVAKAVVVLIILVTSHNEHLEEGHLLTEAVIKVFQGLSDRTRCNDWLRWPGTVRPGPREVLKVHSRGAWARGVSISTTALAATATRRGPACASSHFIFT